MAERKAETFYSRIHTLNSEGLIYLKKSVTEFDRNSLHSKLCYGVVYSNQIVRIPVLFFLLSAIWISFAHIK